jgi:uncharacterized membrane protein
LGTVKKYKTSPDSVQKNIYLLNVPYSKVSSMKKRLCSFFSESKNWAMVYLFIIYLDTLLTLVGTHQPGLAEANPILRTALLTGDLRLPLLSAASIVLVMLAVIKGWNIKITGGDDICLSKTSRALRCAAWMLIPVYFYFTSFGWMYLMSYNNVPPLYGFYLEALGKLL